MWGQTSCVTGDVQMVNETEEKREGLKAAARQEKEKKCLSSYLANTT